MTVGYLTLVWGLPITAGCGAICVLHWFGLTRCLQSIGAAFWAAGFAYDEAKAAWLLHYRETMKAAL